MERRKLGGGDWRRPLLPGAGPLSRIHPAIAFVVVLTVFGLGVWWGGALGAAVLVLLATGLAVLLAVTWPRLTASDRAVRLLVLLIVLAIALERWN